MYNPFHLYIICMSSPFCFVLYEYPLFWSYPTAACQRLDQPETDASSDSERSEMLWSQLSQASRCSSTSRAWLDTLSSPK